MNYIKSLLLLVFVLGAMTTLEAQNISWKTDTHHDFGTMKQFEPKEFDFQFVNLSDQPIIIDNVRTTCGCTAPDWDETPVAPGETGTIKIEYDAKRIGYFEKKVKVFFDGHRKPFHLTIEGEVID